MLTYTLVRCLLLIYQYLVLWDGYSMIYIIAGLTISQTTQSTALLYNTIKYRITNKHTGYLNTAIMPVAIVTHGADGDSYCKLHILFV